MNRKSGLNVVVVALFITASSALAANQTWTGEGSDANWGTAGNWAGGIAPSGGSNLVFNGSVQQNNTNNLSGLTPGWVAFNNGGFVLNGNAINLTNTSASFTNAAGLNIINVGVGIASANAQNWSIAAGSELRITGALTNNSAANPLGSFVGGGTLRITSPNFSSARMLTTFNGTLILDGATAVIANDGFRLSPTNAGQTAAAIITNNGFIQIGGNSSLRMGQLQSSLAAGVATVSLSSGEILLQPAGDNGAPSYGGCITLGENPNVAATLTQSGGLMWLNPLVSVPTDANCGNLVYGANATGNGTYNLNGGVLWLRSIVNAHPGGVAVFNFNGGTLKPVTNSTVFMANALTANVQSGGAIIDTTNFSITIAQNLTPGSPSGGLTKLGTGTLTLSGYNTYTGPTIISNGTLNVSGSIAGVGVVDVLAGILSGPGVITGPVSVGPGGTLSPGAASGTPTTLTLQSNLNLAGNLTVQINKSLSPSNDLVVVNGLLTNSGTASLTLNSSSAYAVGDSFKLFNQPLLNGGAISIMPITPGLGQIWTNRLAIDGTIGVLTQTNATGANLANLTLSVGTLVPAFNSNILSYAATVPYTNNFISITPVSPYAGSTIQVIASGTSNVVTSGSASSPIALNPGNNLIDVRVTAAGNAAVTDYFINLLRTPPNVILILADDQGFSDWSCYGSEIRTPNLDSLAASGLRFRNFHNAARCSPTRCAILTGLYTQQAAVDPSASLPPLRTDNNVTIAEVLGASGYHTYMAGKWHLGSGTGQAPEQRGFEEVFTYISGTADHEDCWDPTQYRFASVDGETTNITYAPGSFYQPDAIGDYCLQFLANQFNRHPGSPFFLYVPFGSAHFLIQAPQAMADTNVALYAGGWDLVRSQRYQNMLAQGVIDPSYALSPNEGTAPWNGVPAEVIPAWSTLDTNRQADLTRRMALYSAMIQKMDVNIGRVVQYLQQNGQLDNTLILALSDNGGNYEGGVYGLYNGVSDAPPVTGTNLQSMGQSGQPSVYIGGGWAHVSNTPFRWFKHFDHFGGTGTPFIVHWPQGLTRTNQWENEQGHIIDVMSTIVNVTGATYPTQWTNSAIGTNYSVLPMQGISLNPWFTTNLADTSRSLGFEHEGNRAYISNRWNLITKNFTSVDGSYYANELELYDLSQDPSQVTNLAYTNLSVLAQMVTNWNNWCTFVGDPASLLITSITNQVVLTGADPAPLTNDLFVDTFDRPNNTNVNASTTGMWGNYVPPPGVNSPYYLGYDAQYLEILDNTLYKTSGGMVESGINTNFTGQDILSAGGFSVELNVLAINSTTADSSNRYVGFGVGLTQAQAASGGDIYNPLSPGQVTFRGPVGGGGNTGVSAFFVDLDMNGNIHVWTNGVLLNTISVGANSGVLTASFACSDFTTNNPVVVNVFFNGQLVNINPFGTNSSGLVFHWSTNNNNYIGLSARASNFAQLDNLAIRKLPLVYDLVTDYAMSYGLSGSNAAPNADPDGDGVSNFGEWAFGGSPTVPDAYIAGFQKIQVLPGNDFRFDFQRYIHYAAVGLQYHYLISSDLLHWTETIPNVLAANVNEDKTDYEVVTLELPATATAGKDHLFLRILASLSN